MYLIDLDTVLSILAYLIITRMFTPIFKVLILSLSERAKNGGILGEEIFCPRAVGFPSDCPQTKLIFSEIVKRLS